MTARELIAHLVMLPQDAWDEPVYCPHSDYFVAEVDRGFIASHDGETVRVVKLG